MIQPTVFEITVPLKHPCFADHFPDKPIVPGALMLQWLLQAINEHTDSIVISSIPAIKFLAVLEPGDICVISLQQAKKADRIKFACKKQDMLILKGELSYAPQG